MSKFFIDPEAKGTQIAGKMNIKHINLLLGLNLPDTEVLMYPGAIKHCKKVHPETFNKYYYLIPEILEIPDYVGINPKEPNSIELYKCVDEDLLLAVKLDPTGYLFVSSLYEVQNGYHKITRRLRTGRIVPFP